MTDDCAAVPHLTIAIVSRQCLVWHGLQKILEGADAFRFDVRPYQRLTPELLSAGRHPNVFIVDLEMGPDAVRTMKQIRESTATSKIVLLSGLENQGYLQEALAYGSDGIILKVQPPGVVLAVIEALYAPASSPLHAKQGGMEGSMLGVAFSKRRKPEPPPMIWPEALTEREREIIRLVEQGLSNKEIAYRLSISDSTVRHHLTSIFDKVGVPNRQMLLIHAHQVRTSAG
jgi:DNA-binding NarL/FixJ family response regulator